LRFTAISNLVGRLHRKIARLRTAQNAIDISGGTMNGVYQVVSVGEQTAVSGKVREPIHRRYVVSGRGHYDRRAMHVCEECIRHEGLGTGLAGRSVYLPRSVTVR
jgi:hypothetical protein